ncbi:YeiH family protein [Acerihabitans sp. TG2]|uniref:YeiH family protein n=1 Tax=Acerihabitans sp. TG2 TaxID=3096008 RepID=UPI002B23896C|nr:YeiH family protein [Acerihabitans sp. TG2]MEA9389223.1 YeiH family protein [Acerihabitans sp. TG2]
MFLRLTLLRPQPLGRLFLHYLPGLLLTGAISLFAVHLGAWPSINGLGLSALTLAILIGIVVGNSVYKPVQRQCHLGVLFSKQRLLRLGIIFYGFHLTFQQISDIGTTGVIIDMLTLSSTFLLACWLGRRVFGLDEDTTMLIGAGSSICGAAAVLATEPVLKASGEKVAVAVATVVIFGTAAIFIYPALFHLNEHFHWLPFTPLTFGIYTGSTMHEVAQVVAASHAISPEAENAAVIAKMIRVMLLAPFLLLLSAWLRRSRSVETGSSAAISFPWFAVLFIGVAGLNSFHLFTPQVLASINLLDTWLLTMAMAALGLTTHLTDLRRAGVRPLLLALLLFIWLIVGGAMINLGIHRLFS